MKTRRMFGMMMAVPRIIIAALLLTAGSAAMSPTGLWAQPDGGGGGGDNDNTVLFYRNAASGALGSQGSAGVWTDNLGVNNWTPSAGDANRAWGNIPTWNISQRAIFEGQGNVVSLGAPNLFAQEIFVRSNDYIFDLAADRNVQGNWVLGNHPTLTNVGVTFRSSSANSVQLSINRIDSGVAPNQGTATFQTNGVGNVFRVNINSYVDGVTTEQGRIGGGNGRTVPIVVTGNGMFNLVGNSTNSTTSGSITGNGNTLHLGATAGNSLTINGAINNGSGDVRFGVGGTTVNGGSVILGTGTKAWGNTIIDLGSSGVVQLNAGVALPTGSNVSFASGSTLRLNGNDSTIASLASADGVGTVANGAAAASTLSITGESQTTFGGTLTNGGVGALSLIRGGIAGTTGSTTLRGNNTYTGSTSVTGGSLIIEGQNTGGGLLSISDGATLEVRTGGSIAATTTTVDGNALINGLITSSGTTTVNGTVSGSGAITTGGLMTVAAGGTLAPGNSIGELNINGDLSFTLGSFFNVEIDEAVPTADLLTVTGTLSLNNATLNLSSIGLANNVAIGTTVLTIATFGTLNGTFTNLANNDIVTVGDNDWRISYGGAISGAITLSAVPEPSALLFVGTMVGVALVRRRR